MQIGRKEHIERSLEGLNEQEYRAIRKGLEAVAGVDGDDFTPVDKNAALEILEAMEAAEYSPQEDELPPGQYETHVFDSKGHYDKICREMVNPVSGMPRECRRGKRHPIHTGAARAATARTVST